MNGSLPPQGPQWRNSQVCWGSTKAPDWPGRIRWLGSVYYLNSPLTTPPGGERGQTVFLPFTRQTCMACLKVSNVHFRPRLNTFHRRVKQTGHFIRKANSFSRENASAQRGPRTGSLGRPPPPGDGGLRSSRPGRAAARGAHFKSLFTNTSHIHW